MNIIQLVNDFFNKRNSEKKQALYRAKIQFRNILEGSEYVTESGLLGTILFSTLGVTDFTMEMKSGVRHITVTLERPGILIGKGGRTIDQLTEEMSKSMPTIIHIRESRLWNLNA